MGLDRLVHRVETVLERLLAVPEGNRVESKEAQVLLARLMRTCRASECESRPK